MFDGAEYLKFFTTLLVMLDPLGAVPLFLSVTPNHTHAERRAIARTAALAVFVILVVCIIVGEAVLRLFSISIASFRVGGGIVFMLMAVSMIQAQPRRTKQTAAERVEAMEKTHVAIVPLAIPLLAGPGAISTVIVYANRSPDLLHTLYLIACVLALAVILWAALRLAGPISRLLGQTGINVVIRVMGLILAAIAVEFIAGGLVELMPGLAGDRVLPETVP